MTVTWTSSTERPILAIDLGGTQIRAALVTPDRSVHCRRAVPTEDEEGVDAVIGRIVEVAAEVRADAPPRGPARADRHRHLVPRPARPVARASCSWPPNLAGWRDVPLGPRVAEALGLPAFLERDTNVAVMGEWRYGAARGTRNAIYITVSTGHRRRRDHRRPPADRARTARPARSATSRSSSTGRAAACGRHRPRRGDRLGHRACTRGPGAPLRTVDRTAAGAAGRGRRRGRRGARGPRRRRRATPPVPRSWTGPGMAIGALCASLVNLLDPEVIVIGGSIAEHHPRLLRARAPRARASRLPDPASTACGSSCRTWRRRLA